MGIWDKVKNAGAKAKLSGEVKLIDRQILARQKQFGVELYDLLHSQKSKQALQTPSIFRAKESQIREPLEACRHDVTQLLNKKDAKQVELEKLQVKQDRMPPSTSNTESMKRAAGAMADTGTEAKINAQLLMIDREINQRKEKFGVEVFDLATAENSQQKSGIKQVRQGIASRLSQMSANEKEIERVVHQAKTEVSVLRTQKQSKEREIARLGAE